MLQYWLHNKTFILEHFKMKLYLPTYMPMYIGLAITVLILKKRIAATTLLFIKGHLCHPHPNELKPDNRQF